MRERLGMSVRQLAVKTGIRDTTIKRHEAGERASWEQLEKYARAFNAKVRVEVVFDAQA